MYSCHKIETDDEENIVDYEKLYLGTTKEKTKNAKVFGGKLKLRNKMRKESMETNEIDKSEKTDAEIDENEENYVDIVTNEETDDAASSSGPSALKVEKSSCVL